MEIRLLLDMNLYHSKAKNIMELQENKTVSSYKRIFWVFGLLLLGVCALAGFMAFNLYSYANSPSGDDATGKIIVITPGQGFSSTTSKLVSEGVITSPARFKMLGALTGDDKKIKAGEYLFKASMSPGRIISDLVNGKVYLHKLTIPEGYNLYQVADVVEREGICDRESFVAAATDPLAVRTLGLPETAESFEGYLYPETYFYSRGTPPSIIVRDMVKRFDTVYKIGWQQRASELGMTRHQVVTLASIIEKETGAAGERPLISSVFHNRMKKDMRLETDPTVIYGIKDFDGNLTREHLRTAGPYNTYMSKGLPIGPIANPGLKSLEAALYPAQSDYLFFVSRKDSTHEFSTNYEDHVANIRKFQLRRH